jgi:Holliday junction resolvase RusA-like endonuclease
MIAFTVPGVPIPQGSKTRWGTEDNPHTRGWRASVAEHAARLGVPVLSGPVSVTVVFTFPRPKAHYRKGKHADELRESAPTWHSSVPDLDKLCRAIGDALAGVVIRNDSQIAAWHVSKLYGSPPRADVLIEPLTVLSTSETLP